MSTNVTLHAGHDVAYFTSGQHRDGCAGAMSYYTATGEPPGEWAGKGAAALGLSGQAEPGVIGRLYQHKIGPGGELLVKRRQSKAAGEREAAAVAAYLAAHPYASATELAEVRAAERGTDPHQVPYFDLTVSAVKSVSVLHASYRVSARRAREHGEDQRAVALDATADEIEDALMDSARDAVAWLERYATYTRTGHHSAQTGEWRDGGGLVASLFLHHLSRDGDPQLHVHVAIWNRVQRADGADDAWRTLDSRTLHHQRLGAAPVTGRGMEIRLSALGYAMVARADGNGAEVGGVGQDVIDLFSSRAVAVTGELKKLAKEYAGKHGRPPSRRTLWLLHQQAGQNTRRTKAEARRTIAGRTGVAEPTAAQRLAAWEDGGEVHRRYAARCNATTRSGRWPSSGSRCTGRCRCCHRAPTARRWSPRWPSWPSPGGRDRGHPGHRAGPHRRDRPGRAGLRRRQHLPAAERRTVLHARRTWTPEEHILTAAKRTLPQLISQEQALASQQQAAIEAPAPASRGRQSDPAAQLEAGRAANLECRPERPEIAQARA